MQNFSTKIADIIEAGWKVKNDDEYKHWRSRVFAFLSTAIDDTAGQKFQELGGNQTYSCWKEYRESQIGYLEGLTLRIEAIGLAKESSSQTKDNLESKPARQTKKVFVVHGHDTEAKETVARFVERLKLEPIILHEQPNSGRTVIEKFEVFSDVGFAIVLLTPDDLGAPSTSPEETKPRARQNVILELGYFIGKLTRHRVCVLYKAGVEIPSDYQGVLYVELDVAGVWRTKLAQELVEAGFSIDLEGLLHS